MGYKISRSDETRYRVGKSYIFADGIKCPLQDI